MKKLIITITSIFAVAAAHATDVATSQAYVDTATGNLQTNLPAKTTNKVVTYTTTAGTTGEREIKTTLGNESTNQSDTGIPTVGTVKTAVDDKQIKVQSLPSTNIVTYTGTNNDSQATLNHYGIGIVTTNPIYDSTVNTFDNGLVTAKTLNDAIIAGVNAEVAPIDDPQGKLWSFNRTPPKVLPTNANLPANVSGISYCSRNIDPSIHPDTKSNCSDTLYNSFSRGDWGVVFPYDTDITYDTACSGTYCGQEVYGISACTSSKPSGYVKGTVVSNEETELIAELESSYNTHKSGGSLQGSNACCYCKMVQPLAGNARWVYGGLRSDGACAKECAYVCAVYLSSYTFMRGALFSASPVPVPAQSE